MRIMFINNEGRGFADYIEVAEGTTTTQLFDEKMPGRKVTDFFISVNKDVAVAHQVLQPNDRVSFTAANIAGACRRC